MPWMIGIDEAGYGPNLGPFVMSAVACQVPQSLVGGDLWSELASAVRRPPAPVDDRLAIDDSKVVYAGGRGLADLELGVLASLFGGQVQASVPAASHSSTADDSTPRAPTLADLVAWAAANSQPDLSQEPWYAGASPVPHRASREAWQAAAERFRAACDRQSIGWAPLHCVVVCPRRFNALLEKWGTKGAVLGQAFHDLLECHQWRWDEQESIQITVDKHGGRNYYAALLQDIFPDGFVVAEQESAEASCYAVRGLAAEIRVRFEPRADRSHFCVALASMASKYLRELLMHEFNAYWQRHVPDLKPTAGYPGDAARFFNAIEPAIRRLGLEPESLWRNR